MTLKLPAIKDPERYVGLFVYDFGSHTSVGYTAGEISILRSSTEHAAGTAYQIYRVHEYGGLELRGVMDERLLAPEAMCFLRDDPATARGDFDFLRQAARTTPIPCLAQIELARLYSFKPPQVTALLYPAASSPVVGQWLNRVAFSGGDFVYGGLDVHLQYASADGIRIASEELNADLDYHDRAAEAVLAAVDHAFQR
ncbi:MAG: hypothetical protein JSV78_09240 [Phycisphaerales bacterium]|nr:MAG: hypothetical protein JSV78_09240 [Phycisphaerales bacterium]